MRAAGLTGSTSTSSNLATANAATISSDVPLSAVHAPQAGYSNPNRYPLIGDGSKIGRIQGKRVLDRVHSMLDLVRVGIPLGTMGLAGEDGQTIGKHVPIASERDTCDLSVPPWCEISN